MKHLLQNFITESEILQPILSRKLIEWQWINISHFSRWVILQVRIQYTEEKNKIILQFLKAWTGHNISLAMFVNLNN